MKHVSSVNQFQFIHSYLLCGGRLGKGDFIRNEVEKAPPCPQNRSAAQSRAQTRKTEGADYRHPPLSEKSPFSGLTAAAAGLKNFSSENNAVRFSFERTAFVSINC